MSGLIGYIKSLFKKPKYAITVNDVDYARLRKIMTEALSKPMPKLLPVELERVQYSTIYDNIMVLNKELSIIISNVEINGSIPNPKTRPMVITLDSFFMESDYPIYFKASMVRLIELTIHLIDARNVIEDPIVQTYVDNRTRRLYREILQLLKITGLY